MFSCHVYALYGKSSVDPIQKVVDGEHFHQIVSF